MLNHELTYLRAVFNELERLGEWNARLNAEVCLATGAQWGEAESLQSRQVRSGLIHFSKTKSSKNRSVPISDDLAKALPFSSG